MYLVFATIQGFIIKNLIELFCQYFKDEICLEFTETGLHCEQITPNGMRLIQFTIWAHALEEYTIDSPFIIGVQLRQLVNIYKSVKKRDAVRMTIDRNQQVLNVCITTFDQRQQISSTIPFFNIQQIKSELITGYSDFISQPTREFIKLIKELGTFDNIITLQIFSSARSLRLISHSCDITEKIITIGSTNNLTNPDYSKKFNADLLHNLNRLNYISQQIRFYYTQKMPLKILCNINDIGELTYYIHDVDSSTPK